MRRYWWWKTKQVLRNSLEVRLRAEGYTVDTAADGNEGLLKATELSFDLIILDICCRIQRTRRVSRCPPERARDSYSDAHRS